MRALRLLILVLVCALPQRSYAAAVVWTCTAPQLALLEPLGLLGITTCTSDTGTYTTGGNVLGAGGAATAAGAGVVLCGSSSRIPIAVWPTLGAAAGTGPMNPVTFDLSTWLLKVYEAAATGLILIEKTSGEAMADGTKVTLLSLCK